ncbi:hypothetical protein EXIGLDRAFT_57070 [Exidia glandulosa HHB12029]|uniref:Uncharacterized protein n=1 Tax=Exidia glandulosa HHB12029 TaxID=1314781 RepID=A0A165I7W8_EXIGL|nr:hypothetical protein EXIGLDRAFT_57070 [Exidia glandulosa HHB12029]
MRACCAASLAVFKTRGARRGVALQVPTMYSDSTGLTGIRVVISIIDPARRQSRARVLHPAPAQTTPPALRMVLRLARDALSHRAACHCSRRSWHHLASRTRRAVRMGTVPRLYVPRNGTLQAARRLYGSWERACRRRLPCGVLGDHGPTSGVQAT